MNSVQQPLTPLPPNAVLGVFGGGQLGRMFAQAAARLGYRVHVFDPEHQPPAAQVAQAHLCADYGDLAAVRRFVEQVDVVTYEFENIPPASVELAAQHVPVYPSPAMLATTRHRVREKQFLRDHGIPVTPFERATEPGALCDLARAWGGSVILKTVEFGYDGKGQCAFTVGDDPDAAWAALGNPGELIVEQRIDLAGECSILLARDLRGQTILYGPFENVHRHHILDTTVWAEAATTFDRAAAFAIGKATADAFGLVGLCCVECFVTQEGTMMVNEIAPRPHNSGHVTIEAFSISQFEQQARMIAGHAAVAPVSRAPAAAMANLLGHLWENGEPDWSSVLGIPAVTLHLYGKAKARTGRKMGHLTALAPTPEEALDIVVQARDRIGRT